MYCAVTDLTVPNFSGLFTHWFCSYTVGGKEILAEIKTGDVIQSAKLVEGLDHLILPTEG